MVGDAGVQHRFSKRHGIAGPHTVPSPGTLFEMLCLWCGKEFLSKIVGNYLHLHGAR